MKKHILILFLVVLFSQFSNSANCQNHKYYLENGIVTASQLGSGKYLLTIDTKSGARNLVFQYNQMEKDMYVYELIKVDDEVLSEYQRSISYLKTRTKFSELCIGNGDRLLLKILGESEIIQLGKE